MIIYLTKKELYDYKDLKGNVIQRWADEMPIQKRDRARLDNRIDILERVEENLPPGLLHPTRCKHICHLVVKGGVTFCPMLCRGPFDMKKEFTFLFGATERDRRLTPKNAPEEAEKNRDDLLSNTKRRCRHERFGEDD